MSEQLEFLRLLAERLESLNVPYMLTGSLAMALYATPRMTRDIDIVIDMQGPQVDELIAEFEGDCYISAEAVQEAVRRRGMFNVIHNELLTKGDFVVKKTGVFWEGEFARRRRVEIEDFHVFVVAPEDLILNKLLWAKAADSSLQLRDVKQIVHDMNDLDMEYIRQWAGRLSVEKQLEDALS